MTIYNCHHDGDQYRVTKFTDEGNPESTYLCTHAECECPAGVRDTCRHRQMLPVFLERGLVNHHHFINWDMRGHPTVDFQGRIVLPNLPSAEDGGSTPPAAAEDEYLEGIMNRPTNPEAPVGSIEELAKCLPAPETTNRVQYTRNWRRF